MPNPFASLGAIDVMGTIQNMLQRQATLRDTQLLGDEREQTIQIRKQEMQERQNTMQVLARELQGGISATDKSNIPAEDDSPITLAQKQVRRFQQEAQQLSQTARELAQGNGTPSVAMDYLRRAKEAEARVIPAMRELRLEQRDQAKTIGELAGAANAENFGEIMGQLKAQDPRIERKYNFDRDANDQPVWGDKTQRTMTTLRDASMTAKEQLDEKIKTDKAKQAAIDHEVEMQKKRADAKKADAEAAMAQNDAARVAKGLPKVGHEGQPKKTEEEKDSDLVKKAANVQPTGDMVKAAKASVDAFVSEKFPGAKKDSTMNAFAEDVATRANTLRADALARGQKLSVEDARQQAMEILGQFLKTTDPVKHWLGEDEPRKVSYRRSGVKPAVTAVKALVAPTQIQTADDYLKSIGVQ